MKFAQLEPEDIENFHKILGSSGVITDKDELAPLNQDWMRKYIGGSKLALLPKTTEEVSKILQYCNGRKLAVIP